MSSGGAALIHYIHQIGLFLSMLFLRVKTKESNFSQYNRAEKIFFQNLIRTQNKRVILRSRLKIHSPSLISFYIPRSNEKESI